MFQPWRQQLRDAAAALKGGRLDDACRLLSQGDLRHFAPAQSLSSQLAQQIVCRAETEISAGDTSAGWRDVQTAAAWGADAAKLSELQARLTQAGLKEATAHLEAGATHLALEKLQSLHGHQVANAACRTLRQAAGHVLAAEQRSATGNFSLAQVEWERAASLLPQSAMIRDRLQRMQVVWNQYRGLLAELHRALAAQQWSDVLSVAEQMLQLAPACAVARDARQRAWVAVGTPPAALQVNRLNRPWSADRSVDDTDGIRPRNETPASDPRLKLHVYGIDRDWQTMNQPRFILWVDGVGGYLVVLADRVSFGPPAPSESTGDIGILGDLSRRHATLHRDGESYILQPGGRVAVDDRPLSEPRRLADNQRIQLGSSVQLRFRQPHSLSNSARLEFVSRHRTQPAADAVLLMADALVLGPHANCHVVCGDWPSEVVIFRQGEQIFCRTKGQFEVDGQQCSGKALLAANSNVMSEHFSFTLEPI